MIPLVRLVYVSTVAGRSAGIRDHLIKLQQKAIFLNQHGQNTGMLFYGNSYFFECIEGDKDAIDLMYCSIVYDGRHKNIVLLSYQIIDECHFAQWNMHFVNFEPAIQNFFYTYYKKAFNPYLLNHQPGLGKFLNILYQHVDNLKDLLDKERLLLDITDRGSVQGYKYIIYLGMAALIIIISFYLIMIHM